MNIGSNKLKFIFSTRTLRNTVTLEAIHIMTKMHQNINMKGETSYAIYATKKGTMLNVAHNEKEIEITRETLIEEMLITLNHMQVTITKENKTVIILMKIILISILKT